MDFLSLLSLFHVVVAIFLVLFVLLQDPKGGGAAGVFGGGGSGQSSLFGASGAGSFLSTLTKWTAVVFAVTSVATTYMTSHSTNSVLDDFVPEASQQMETPPVENPVNESAPAEENSEKSEPQSE